MSGKQRVGYLGGTFDPPHLGHLIMAHEAFFQLDLDSLRWILTPDPPHKTEQEITDLGLRLKMLQLMVDPIPEFEISMLDIDRKAPHFAADTVEMIKTQDPTADLIYLIGEDSLQDLPEWRDSTRFLDRIDILAVAPRPGIASDLVLLERYLPGLHSKIRFLDKVMNEISSSLIRSRVENQQPFRHYLPVEVGNFIARNGIYDPLFKLA